MKSPMKNIARLLLLACLIVAGSLRLGAQSNSVLEMGVAGQVAVTNNIIPGGQQFPIGPPACDVGHFDTACIQINPTGTVTGGTIQFQGSNDDVNFTPVFFFDLANDISAPVSSVTPATGVVRIMAGPLVFRFFRASITSPVTGGGSVQSYSTFATTPFSSTQAFATDPSGSLAVTMPDNAITGQGSQTTLNNNVILATAGAGGQSAAGYRSWSIEIVPAAGTVTGGVITFEGSNDNVNWAAIDVIDQGLGPFTNPLNNYGVAAATPKLFKGPINFSFIRARISTGLTGTSTGVQAFTVLSTQNFTNEAYPTNQVTILGSNIVTAGSNGVQAIGGNIANGTTPTANPVLTAGITQSTLPGAAVANAKTQTIIMSGDGQQIVHLNGDPSHEWTATSGTTPLATNSSTLAQAAGAAGVRNYVTDIHVINTSATVSTTFSILDGATVIWTTFLSATTAALPEIPVTIHFETPLKGTAATALNVQCGTTSASVYYNIGGFQNN